jgi:hypothetical protein
VDIEDGSVSTSAFGSGYWVAIGITWTADAKTGKQDVSLTLAPREDLTSPDADLLTLQAISPQAEWQIGWTSPNPLTRDLEVLARPVERDALHPNGRHAGQGRHHGEHLGGEPHPRASSRPHRRHPIQVREPRPGRRRAGRHDDLLRAGGWPDRERLRVQRRARRHPVRPDHAITDGSIVNLDTYATVTEVSMPPLPTLDPPTGLTLTSAVVIDADGHQIVELKAALTAATTPGISGYKIELTTTASGPDWTAAKVLRAPLGTLFVRFQVPGNVGYSVRAASEDVYGRVSAYTAIVTHTATKDGSAPATPTGLAAANSILGIGVTWTSNTEADFDHYDLLVDDDVAFGSPLSYTYRGSLAAITPLTAGTWYVKVRAVDTSGNASAYCVATSAVSRLAGTSDIDPTAVINQATNLINGPATVTINSSGLTITNGALTLQDEFGKTVMVASGFSGSWQTFITLGLYNANFGSGAAGAVANGRTSALPYWTASTPDGASGALTYETGAQPDVKMTWAAINKRHTIVSDKVPVNANRYYEWGCYVTVNANGTCEVDFSIQINWYKADLTASATPTTGPFTAAYVGGITSNNRNVSGVAAPSDAAFAEVQFAGKAAVLGGGGDIAASYAKVLLAWLTSTSANFGADHDRRHHHRHPEHERELGAPRPDLRGRALPSDRRDGLRGQCVPRQPGCRVPLLPQRLPDVVPVGRLTLALHLPALPPARPAGLDLHRRDDGRCRA